MANRYEMVAILPEVKEASGGMSSPTPGYRPAGCAMVRFRGTSAWELLPGDGRDWFFRQFNTIEGTLSVRTDLTAYDNNSRWLFDIQAYDLKDRPSSKGCVVLARNGYVCAKYTHYWRVLDVANLTDDEKMAEAAAMLSDEIWAEMGAKFKAMLTIGSAVWMVILGVMFASGVAEVVAFACVLLIGMSVPILADDLAKIATYLGKYKAKVRSARTEEELREAAVMAAQALVALIEALVTVAAIKGGVKRTIEVTQAKAAAVKARSQAEGAPGEAAPRNAGGAKPSKADSLAEMPARIKTREPNSGATPFSDFPEFRNKSLSKDLYPWLKERFTKVKSAKLDSDGYVDSKGGSEIWARRIPGTNLVECVRIDLVSMKGASRGHNPPFKDGPVLQTAQRAGAKFEGGDPSAHYGRMIQGEGQASGTTLTTERVAYGKVGHFHKETIRTDQLGQYCQEYVPSAKGVADWGAGTPRSGPQKTADGAKVFKGAGATNNAAHIPLLP